MQSTAQDNINKVWALNLVINRAVDRANKLKDQGTLCDQQLLSMMDVISDMSNKISHARWTDDIGLNYAATMYTKIIDKL